MIQNIKPITEDSNAREINSNFEAIQTAILNKQLAFHYLNLYNLKGPVIGIESAITTAYNLLNLNEALLIVDSSASWRKLSLNIGDYLVKTMAGPLRIPGPITGYYKPRFNNQTELAFTYTTTEPSHDDPPITANIQGASSSGGYDRTYTLYNGETSPEFPKQGTTVPIIQIYHGDTLIDYPYTLNPVGESAYTITLNPAWSGAQFTIRVR